MKPTTLTALAAVVLAIEGCGDEPLGETVCATGETQLCHCGGGGEGAQACLDDRSGWYPCDCGGSGGDADADVEADADAAHDADASPDADADIETDADAAHDADVSPDADADIETDADAAHDADVSPDADADIETDADAAHDADGDDGTDAGDGGSCLGCREFIAAIEDHCAPSGTCPSRDDVCPESRGALDLLMLCVCDMDSAGCEVTCEHLCADTEGADPSCDMCPILALTPCEVAFPGCS